jgi:hypothetical protein
MKAPGDVGEFAVEVFETPICGMCRTEDGEEAEDASTVKAATSSEELMPDKSLRKVEVYGQPKCERKSTARRSRRQRHGTAREATEGPQKQEADAQVCQGIHSDLAVG